MYSRNAKAPDVLLARFGGFIAQLISDSNIAATTVFQIVTKAPVARSMEYSTNVLQYQLT